MKKTPSMRGKLREIYFSDHSVVFYLVLALVMAYVSVRQLDMLQALGLFLLGWLIYLPEEYFSHVLVFHGPMPKSPALYRLLYRLHLGHHDKPRRIDLLFTPMWYTLPSLVLNVWLFFLVTRDVHQSAALVSGLIVGYLMFEWWHLLVHSPHQPGRILRYVRRQHMGHHHWNEKRWYIISPPAVVLDRIFGTGGSVQQSPKSLDPMTSGLAADDERLVRARTYYRDASDWKEDESAIWQVNQHSSLP